MKRLLFAIAFLSICLLGCKKDNSSTTNNLSPEGKWRMVLVQDNSSGASITKPATISGDVDMIITSGSTTAGTFKGVTPTNTVNQNDYTTDQHQSLSIPNLSMTKVAETTWGNEFVNNIRFSTSYSFASNGKLVIKTAAKTLTFMPL